MPAAHYSNLKLPVNTMHVVLGDNIPPGKLEEAEADLQSFVTGFQGLFGLQNVTYNLHLLTHLCELTRWMGPIWCYSNFVFESANGRLIKLIRGTRSICNEVAVKFSKLLSVSRMIEKIVRENVLAVCNNILGYNLSKSSFA